MAFSSEGSMQALRLRLLAILTCVIVSATVACAADESLASLVAPDAALFVEVRGLERHWQELTEAELFRRWEQSALHETFWSGPVGKRWLALDAQVALATGKTLTGQLRPVFGENVALALFLPLGRGPEGVLLSRASSADAIDKALESWNRIERPSRTDRIASPHAHYFRRVVLKPDGEHSLFYARQDRLFVLSDREDLVRGCIERANHSAGQGGLDSTPEFREIGRRSPGSAWLLGFVNPRRWDAVLERDAAQSPPQARLFDAWKAFRGIGAAVDTDRGVHAEIAVLLDEGRTTSAWRDFALESHPPSILQAAPAEAVAAIGARVRWPWLIAEWERLLSAEDREGFERGRRVLKGLLLDQDVITQAVPQLLGDWGAFAVPGDSNGRWWQRGNLTGIAFLPPQLSDSVRDGVDNALVFAMNAVAADQNGKSDSASWHLMKSQTGEATQRVLIGPARFEPCFAWRTDKLVFANHPQLLTMSLATGNRRLNQTAAEQFPTARVFAWLNLESQRSTAAKSDAEPPFALLRNLSELAEEAFASASWTETELKLRVGLNVTSK